MALSHRCALKREPAAAPAEATAAAPEAAAAPVEAAAAPAEATAAPAEGKSDDPKARFKTFAVSGSQETSENGLASGATPVGDPPPAPESAPAAPAEPDPALLDRIQSLEESLALATAGTEQLNQSFQMLMGHVTAITNAVNEMMQSLGATPGYGAGHSLVCPSCGDAGHLAIPLTCSSCGESPETGWWPDQ